MWCHWTKTLLKFQMALSAFFSATFLLCHWVVSNFLSNNSPILPFLIGIVITCRNFCLSFLFFLEKDLISSDGRRVVQKVSADDRRQRRRNVLDLVHLDQVVPDPKFEVRFLLPFLFSCSNFIFSDALTNFLIRSTTASTTSCLERSLLGLVVFFHILSFNREVLSAVSALQWIMSVS